MEEEKDKTQKQGQISRREFLKDAGLIVGGATVGSMAILSACSGGETATETKTATVTNTKTVTNTVTTTVNAGGGGATTTVTVTATPPGATTENIVKFTVNGVKHEISVKPEWTLRYVLHDILGYASLKYMCYGGGACGSCSVILNGRPVLSCMTLAIECDGITIETAEGIAAAKHPLVEAYIENYCFQCGYCTPGFLVTVKALLDRNAKPTEEQVWDAIAGNLCRCGTYPQHVKAALQATKS